MRRHSATRAPAGENTRRCKGQSVGTLELHSPLGPLPAGVEAGLRRDVDRLPGARRDRSTARSRSRCCTARSPSRPTSSSASAARRERRRSSPTPTSSAVIDAGEDGGRPYIVFEYVEGETLKRRIQERGRAARRRGGRLRDRDRPRPDRRPRAQARPPRRQAPERPDRSRRAGQGDRLRHRPVARAEGNDRDRPGARHDRLRLARAGDGRGRRRALRRLLARRRPLRDAHRRRPLPGRDPGRRGDEARQRADARRAGQAPGGLGRGRLGGRPRRPPRTRATATTRSREMVATSSRPSRSRPPARGGTSGEATSVLDSVPSSRRRLGTRRSRLGIAMGVIGAALIAAALIIVVPHIHLGGKSNPPASGGTEVKLPVDAASEFDPPPGDGRETGTERLATDSNPTGTAWTTEHYDTADFGGLKDGVGLAIDAGSTVPAKSIVIRSPDNGVRRGDLRVRRLAAELALRLGPARGHPHRRRGHRDDPAARQVRQVLPDLDHQAAPGQGRPRPVPDGDLGRPPARSSRG